MQLSHSASSSTLLLPSMQKYKFEKKVQKFSLEKNIKQTALHESMAQ